LPYLIVDKFPNLINLVCNFENLLLEKKLNKKITKPIFVTGLARSGSTIITHILNCHSDLGSYQYKDLPYIEIPYLWSFFNKIFYFGLKDKKRIHGDGLFIGPNSPDPFEEIIWKKNLKNNYLKPTSQFLSKKFLNKKLEKELKENINKILYVRGSKKRYLSKGNYNITRLEYIIKLFPNAKIIVCIRSPKEQAISLTKVHKKFLDLSKTNKYLEKQLDILGHYEFGPNRRAVYINENNFKQIQRYWRKRDDISGYLLQWSGIYKLIVEKYLLNKNISSNIHIVDNNMLINKPEKIIKNILNFCELKYDKFLVKKMYNLVKLKNKEKKRIENKSRIEIDNIKLYKKILTEFVKQ
tara:strand:- start:615 stop:1676 length:1062 start_codon:yes stop_codon:yes gene_type:complete